MSAETLLRIEKSLIELGFNRKVGKGKRMYTLETNIIKRRFMQYLVVFEKDIYTIGGLLTVEDFGTATAIFNKKEKVGQADFDSTALTIKNTMLEYYHNNLLRSVYSAANNIKDSLVDYIHDALLEDVALPDSYSAVALDCIHTVEGYVALYQVTSPKGTYVLDVKVSKPITLGEYKPKKKEHYSDQILNILVSKYGWEHSISGNGVVKDLYYTTNGGGALNPDGKVIVYGTFDDSCRYLTLQVGFKDIFDIDCRDPSPEDCAKDFDAKVNARMEQENKVKNSNAWG